MRYVKLTAIILLAAAVIVGCGTKGVTEPVYENNKTLHIGAWVAPPPGYITDAAYRDIAESGINCIYALYEGGDDALAALELAGKHGIGYLVRDWALSGLGDGEFDQAAAMVERYKDYPAFMGHLIADEPGTAQFGRLGGLRKAYNAALPDKLCYINLFPMYASQEQLNGVDYETYVDEYMKTVQPTVLSYDFYPLLRDGTGTFVMGNYLRNLEIISKAAIKYDVPWWNFLQAMSFNNYHRSPKYEDLRWQAYTTLAFGGSGIQYFCYWTPLDGGGETFGDALVDREGNKTPIFDYAKRLNNELLAFDHILLSYKSVGQMVFPVKRPPTHAKMEQPLESFAPVKSVDGGPVLVGCFEDDDGNAAVMLVNMLDPGKMESVEVTISFANARELNVYTDGAKERVVLNGGEYSFVLGAGEGKFVQILK